MQSGMLFCVVYSIWVKIESSSSTAKRKKVCNGRFLIEMRWAGKVDFSLSLWLNVFRGYSSSAEIMPYNGVQLILLIPPVQTPNMLCFWIYVSFYESFFAVVEILIAQSMRTYT